MAFVADGIPIPAVKADGESYEAEDANNVLGALLDLRSSLLTLLTVQSFQAFGAGGAGVTKAEGAAVPGYYKDPFGRVHLKGSMTLTVAGEYVEIFSAANGLPANHRPATNRQFAVVGAISGVNTPLMIDVTASGSISVNAFSYDGSTGLQFGISDTFQLDGISFRAEV